MGLALTHGTKLAPAQGDAYSISISPGMCLAKTTTWLRSSLDSKYADVSPETPALYTFVSHAGSLQDREPWVQAKRTR